MARCRPCYREVDVSTTEMGVFGVGLALFLMFVSGILLWRSGKPYSTALITIHKLVGIGAGVWLGVMVYRAAPLGPVAIAAIAVTVLLFLILVATGGLLSIDRPMPIVVRRLHQVVPVLAVLVTAGMLYLLLSGT